MVDYPLTLRGSLHSRLERGGSAIARCEVCGRRVKQPSRAIINGRIVCAVHNPRPDQRAHRRDERPRRDFDRPEPMPVVAAGPGAPAVLPAASSEVSGDVVATAPAVAEAAAAPAQAAPPEAPAVTPQEVPAPGEQDTVPPVEADPALQEKAGEPVAETDGVADETAESKSPTRRTRRASPEAAEAETST
jgi:hypothetical protein